jgi:ATP-dependent exoDNAse (exonuclease V) beta subunit
MKINQFQLGATINLGEYSDLRPVVTVEVGDEESPEVARQLALEQINKVWSRTSNKQLQTHGNVDQTQRQPVKCFVTGTDLYFDPVGHSYVDADGQEYVSGSMFAEQFAQTFQKHLILPKSAARLKTSEDTVAAYWQSKADISTSFGTALHKALEHYGKYHTMCETDGKGTGIHPTLEPIVQQFFSGREEQRAKYEVVVADPITKRCGTIDRLVVTGDRHCVITDYKTNGNLYKKGTPAKLKAPYHYLPNVPLSRYMIQLSFYKAVMEAAGWTVDALLVEWWNGEQWQTIEIQPVEIDTKQAPINLADIE